MTFNRKGLGLYVDLSVTKMILGFGLHSVAAAGRHSARCCSAETGDWSDGTVLCWRRERGGCSGPSAHGPPPSTQDTCGHPTHTPAIVQIYLYNGNIGTCPIPFSHFVCILSENYIMHYEATSVVISAAIVNVTSIYYNRLMK